MSPESHWRSQEQHKKKPIKNTKLNLHANHYLASTKSIVTIWWSSGDADIFVLAFALLNKYKERAILINSHEPNQM